ncbi:MAG: sensor histidine kinase [Chloroflexota bacterium]
MLDVLNERLESAQEEERARLAAELHDEPLQTALYLDRQLRGMNRQVPGSNVPVDLSGALAGQLRAICLGMRPVGLDDLGLLPALDALVEEARDRSGAEVTFEADEQLTTISPAVELILYRVAQEALNNCLKHADASEVTVTVRRDEGGIKLSVADDGMGQSGTSLTTEGCPRLGLLGLRERLRPWGGTVSVETRGATGTTVTARVNSGESHGAET